MFSQPYWQAYSRLGLDVGGLITGAPNEKRKEKGLECSFLLSRIALWPFKKGYVCELTLFDL